MTTATRQKQLGLTGIHGNTIVTSNKPSTPLARSHTSQKAGISIGGNWKITNDELNIIVSRRRGGRYEAEGFFSTLAGALSYLVDQHVRDNDLADLKAVVARIEELKAQIVGIAAG